MAKKSKYTPTEKRKARPLGPDAQLCDRLQAAEILGISYGSVRVLEKKGRLKGRRLHEGKSSRLMFPVVEVLKIAKVDDAIRVLPDLGSVIVVNGKTYREVTSAKP